MVLTQYIQLGLPFSLALIMLSMGLMLSLNDFQRVAVQPKAFITGLAAQMLLVPLIALLMLQIFSLPPLLAVGLLVLSFSPGGTTSNLFSYLAKGDVALSVSLTAVASLITPFSIPLLTELALQAYLVEHRQVAFPIGLTMMRLVMITLLPVTVGMVWRLFCSASAAKIQPLIHRLSVLMFITVIAAIIIQQWSMMSGFLVQVGDISMLMVICAMLIGYLVAKSAKLDRRQIKTICIEVGMQNGGMALVVTQTVLHNATMSIVPVIYGLLMLFPVVLFVGLAHRETTAAV